MSYSKTRTTYRPSTHPRWAKGSNAAVQDLQIHIHVMPAPTLAELTAMRDQIVCHTDDLTVWKRALHAEAAAAAARAHHEAASCQYGTHSAVR